MYIGAGVITTVVGFFLASLLLKNKKFINIAKKEKECEKLIVGAKVEASKIKADTHDQKIQVRERMEKEVAKKEERLEKLKESLKLKNERVEKRQESVNNIKLKIASFSEEIQSKNESAKRTAKEAFEKLSKITGKSKEAAHSEIMKKYEVELRENGKRKLANEEENFKEEAGKIAKKILLYSMQRITTPTSVETRAVLIKVPKDNIKGKIVGRDGVNVLALEKELEDVAVIFNDLPNTISVSCFNLVKRRIAEKTIKKLIKIKGGIDEAVVKKTLKQAEKDTDDELFELGKKALDKMGIKNNNKELTRIVGRLQYRTSYGQNIMKHSKMKAKPR